MRNDKLISEYMKFNKVLLSTINLDEERIYLFDGEKNLTFKYEEFFFYIAKITLLSLSKASRVFLVLGLMDILLLIRSIEISENQLITYYIIY